MKRASHIRILSAILALSFTILRNIFFLRRSRAGYKNAVPPRKQKIWLQVLLIPLFFIQAFMFGNSTVESIKLENHLQAFPNQILVDQYELLTISDHFASDRSNSDFYWNSESTLRSDHKLPAVGQDEVLSHYKEYGRKGFITPSQLQLIIEPELKTAFGNQVGRLLFMLSLGLLFISVSTRLIALKQQRGKDDVTAYLPIAGWQSLLGMFLTLSLVRIFAWMSLLPILTWVFTALGHSFGLSLLIAFPTTIFLSAIISGVEMVIDIWLRFAAHKKLVNLVQKVTGILGILVLYFYLATIFSPTVMGAALQKIALLDGGHNSIGDLFTQDRPAINLLIFSGIIALLSGWLGCFLAGKILDRGVVYSLNEQAPRNSPVDSREKKLWEFEKLALMRNRGLAAQILMIPFAFMAYQFFINPNFSGDGITFSSLCALGFGVGSYACLLTIQRLFSIEQQGLWIVYSLPIETSDYFGRRERMWRIVGASVGSALVIGGLIWYREFTPHSIALGALTILGLWLMGRVVNGIILSRPKFQSRDDGSQNYTPNVGKTYLAMLVVGGFVSLIYQGHIWPLIVASILVWLLGKALSDRQRLNYQYLLDPTLDAPRTWGVDSALWLLVIFFVGQLLGAAALSGIGHMGLTLLISFIFGGLVALVFAWRMGRKMEYPLPPFQNSSNSIWSTLLLALGCALSCFLIAWGWLWALEFLRVDLPDSTLDSMKWELLILAVLGAPLVEEPIFRGKIFRAMMTQWSEKNAMLVSSLLFAIIHPAYSFLPVFCLGLSCAWLYRRCGSLWPTIFTHALYNFGVVYFLT